MVDAREPRFDVREARPDDARAMLECHVAAIEARGPVAYDDAQVAAWAERDRAEYPIEDDDHYVVVAEVRDDRPGPGDRHVVGFGDLDAAEGEVQAVYVHPDFDRRGVGSALLDDLQHEARLRGLTRLSLVASRNAIGFYDRQGYGVIDALTHETGGEALTCVEMERPL